MMQEELIKMTETVLINEYTKMTDEDILEASEVFALPSGRYLIVEG